MNTDEHRSGEVQFNAITEKVIGCAYTVHNARGCGFLEKVYENALAHELRKSGMAVAQQARIEVWYDGVCVGEYLADLLVEGLVITELKCVRSLEDVHWAQCLNYLKASGKKVGLPLNFAKPRLEIKRLMH